MGKNNNTIKLNGKHYDATTGTPIHGNDSMKTQQHLDGILAPNGGSPAVIKPSASAHRHEHSNIKRPTMQDVVHPDSRHHASHRPQPARTLMRRAVSKPEVKRRPIAKASGYSDQLVNHSVLELAPKLSVSNVDNRRLKHAKVIQRSKLISRYNIDGVAARPTPSHHQTAERPAIAPAPRPQQPAVGRATTTADLLQHAIDQANSHRQPAPKVKRTTRNRTRIMSISTLATLSLLLFGFVLHQNMPNIRLDLASSKAGFAASLPADQPAGFSLSSIGASTGQVALRFRSNSDESRSYTITEKASAWDSATLRDSFVAGASSNTYQTVEAAGRTAYIYGHQNITWVNGGIWYEVHSDGALSNQQLINIAASV